MLPNIDKMFPQSEPILFAKCTMCSTGIYVTDDYYEAAGYLYCEPICYANLSLIEGNLERKVAGE